MTIKAITKAQEIVESTVDIRPILKGKTVVNVDMIDNNPLHIKVLFSDGSHIHYTGLFARLITDCLIVETTLNNIP